MLLAFVFFAVAQLTLLSGCRSTGAQRLAGMAELSRSPKPTGVAISQVPSDPLSQQQKTEQPQTKHPKTQSKFGLVSYQQDSKSSRRTAQALSALSVDETSKEVPQLDFEEVEDDQERPDETELESSDEAKSEDSDKIESQSDSEAQRPTLTQPTLQNSNALTLEQLLTSVNDCYPEIEIAIGEIETANGKILASWGEFDQVFTAHSISQPLGFYQTYRNGVGLARPLFSGGEVYGTYRIGDGNFEPWYGERETNEGGEFKAGFSVPLLKDRAIDQRRAKLFSSELQRDQIEANVQSRLLQFQRFATQGYWDWVASGQAVQIQQQILQLAEERVGQIEQRIEKGDLAQIAQIDNDRFIAKRKNDLTKARRSLEKAAIKLSLFWRNQDCAPVVVDKSQLPTEFPESFAISDGQLDSDIQTALNVRPELQELIAAREEVCIDLQYAKNLTLPKIDLKGFAGQDVGGETSSKGDKTPFELQIGVLAEVPLQRRKGQGKIQAAQVKLTQIDAKRRFVSDKIRAEVQDAASAVNAAYQQIEQSGENVRLTRKSLELGRLSFREGDIDLIALNIYESAVADAELELLEAQFKYFFYRTVYQTAISANFR